MKLGIIGDTHLGYSWGTSREDDSFIQAEEGLNKLLDEGVDVIIHTGDVFHSSIPRPEVMARAMDLLSECRSHESTVSITNYFGREPPKNKPMGVPVIAVRGNHERRPKGMTDPLQVLEKAGLLIRLHCSGLSLNDEVGVFGMGYVPERYALSAIKEWNVSSGLDKNFLVLHQTIREVFSVPGEPATITLSDLPGDFFTICGHIHWSVKKPNLLVPGSTIRTQMRKNETGGKFVYVLDSESGDLEEIRLETSRELFYEEVSVSGKTPDKIIGECEKLAEKLEGADRSIMKIKLVGKLGEGFESGDLKLGGLRKKSPYLFVDRDFESEQALPTLPEGAGLNEMLAKSVEKAVKKRGLKIDVGMVIDYLLAGDMDKVFEVLAVDSKSKTD